MDGRISVNRLREITGSSEDAAREFLSSFSGSSLEAAVNAFMSPRPQTTSSRVAERSQDPDESPISRRALHSLGPPRAPASGQSGGSSRTVLSRRMAHNSGMSTAHATSQGFVAYQIDPTNPNPLRRDPNDLFRPPYEITYPGDFFSAKESASQSNKWLLVNIQNSTEFACQTLNRDVWTDRSIRSILEKSFLFLQESSDRPEGKRYNQFYPVTHYPYVAILDPRTGELLEKHQNMTASSLHTILSNFLIKHGTPNSPVSNGVTAAVADISLGNDEDFQAAIRASLQESNHPSGYVESSGSSDSDDDSFTGSSSRKRRSDNLPPINKDLKKLKLEQQGDPMQSSSSVSSFTGEVQEVGAMLPPVDTSAFPTNVSMVNGSSSGDVSVINLLLKCPDGERRYLTLSGDANVEQLMNGCAQLGYSDFLYEFTTHFPKLVLNVLDRKSRLAQLGISSNRVIFVEPKL